ncbi:MAG: hypothetical protein NTW30_04885 [Candidatus Aenigmarchaeota archaeon]|nr:hypothetical protein [Candidatus Aenigmarchaeota archaeon]
MKRINLEEYGRKVFQFKDVPSTLDSLGIELIGFYSYYQSMMIPLELKEAKFWQDNKDWKSEKPKSDATVKALWRCTDEGMEMLELDRTIKTIDKLCSMIKSSVRRAESEQRNSQ